MKKMIFIIGVALTATWFSCGESQKPVEGSQTTAVTDVHDHDHDALASAEIIKLCGDCGEIKGSDKCCRKDAEKCGKCGLIKGSPGCCKIQGDTELCSKCGEIKGSEKCCNKEAEKCGKCGLIKGSPGCCKIKK